MTLQASNQPFVVFSSRLILKLLAETQRYPLMKAFSTKIEIKDSRD